MRYVKRGLIYRLFGRVAEYAIGAPVEVTTVYGMHGEKIGMTSEQFAAWSDEWEKRGRSGDEYLRLRNALNENRRVFFQIPMSKEMVEATMRYFDDHRFPPSQYFIEGVDIPYMPDESFCRATGVLLTGECRVPNIGEKFVGITSGSGRPVDAIWCDCVLRISPASYFGGRRWIVKDAPSNREMSFESWWEGNHKEYGLREKDKPAFRDAWISAREFK